MPTELRNFLALSYDELEELNLHAKEQRRKRVATIGMCGKLRGAVQAGGIKVGVEGGQSVRSLVGRRTVPAGPYRDINFGQPMPRITPPSTRSAAPDVADAWVEQA